MGATIRILNHVDEIAQFFSELLIAEIHKNSERYYFSLALSGGSTPKAVFKYLASNCREIIPWERILFFWSDERCVSPESEDSNYRMAREYLLDYVPVPSENIFRIMGEENPDDESDRYSDIVRNFVPANSGIPQFNMIMLGLGDDGHTASIFPDNQTISESDKLFTVAENPYTRQKRITASYNIINQASTILFLVTGTSKAEILANVIEKKEGWNQLPASKVKPLKGEIIWLVDAQAASKLTF